MTEFKDIDKSKVLTVSEYIVRPDGTGTALVKLRGQKVVGTSYKKEVSYTKGPALHVSLTREEHTSIKAR